VGSSGQKGSKYVIYEFDEAIRKVFRRDKRFLRFLVWEHTFDLLVDLLQMP